MGATSNNSMPDRLGPILKPGRPDHRRQALHQVTQGSIRLALGPDGHSRSEVRQGGSFGAECQCGVVAAAQML